MGRAPASVATFKKFYADPSTKLDKALFEKEIAGANDRSVIITLAAFLDDALVLTIKKKLRKLPEEEAIKVFRHDGPLGKFSSRIDMAYWLGCIDQPAKDALHIIREIRNVSAHSKKQISFSSIELQNVTKRLFNEYGIWPKKLQEGENNIRKGFAGECFFLMKIVRDGRTKAYEMITEKFKAEISSRKKK